MVIFNKLFNPIIALLIAGFFFISGADPASAKMDPYTDGQIAVDLCSKLILENKDGFSVLASRGYRVKKKKNRTVYDNGVGNVTMFGAPGIHIVKYSNGCAITIQGIAKNNGDKIYMKFQQKFAKRGYEAIRLKRKNYLTNGTNMIKYSGGYYSGSSMRMNFARIEN